MFWHKESTRQYFLDIESILYTQIQLTVVRGKEGKENNTSKKPEKGMCQLHDAKLLNRIAAESLQRLNFQGNYVFYFGDITETDMNSVPVGDYKAVHDMSGTNAPTNVTLCIVKTRHALHAIFFLMEDVLLLFTVLRYIA